MKTSIAILCLALAGLSHPVSAEQPTQGFNIPDRLNQQVIEWRRDLHQHPELSNQEFRTAKVVAEALTDMGLEVETGIAETGVVAFLKGTKPGPTIALRADMDALPVTEQVDLPFASKVRATYEGNEVGVMHACGHDTHVAMLLGAARALVDVKDQLAGNVLFIFQPAEEGVNDAESWGARQMLEEGIFEKHKPSRAFGIHVLSQLPAGMFGYRAGPAMAAYDRFSIDVKGRQGHGSSPWAAVDPVVTAAEIISSTQAIISRKTDLTKGAAVISYGIVKGGIRNNIIPDTVYLEGTIRTFDPAERAKIRKELAHVAEHEAKIMGAEASVTIYEGYPVVVNDEAFTAQVLDSVGKVAKKLIPVPPITGSEDFAFYSQLVPSTFLFLGITPEGQDPARAAPNHSPNFYVDESALRYGSNAFVQVVLDYLQ